MNIVLWIVLGAVAGWVASLIMGTNDRQNTLGDIVIGMIGGVLGGFILGLIGQVGVTGFNLYSLIVSVFGAVVLVWLKRELQRV